jgi:hypothetical protein
VDIAEASSEPPGGPAHRVVVLGASNAAIGISVAIESAWQALGQPLDFMAALGFGRSYGIQSWVLGRSLPGILHCGMWQELARRPRVSTTAVLTDIGNDLVYEVPVEQATDWVETCLQRLSACADRLIVTELPLASIERLTQMRFLLMRTILFPKCRLDLRTAVDRAVCLNEAVADLAVRYGARRVRPSLDWYGFDPIHVLKRYRREFWEKIFFAEERAAHDASKRLSFSQRFFIRRRRPLQRSLFGWQQTARQPAGQLPDGTSVSLY